MIRIRPGLSIAIPFWLALGFALALPEVRYQEGKPWPVLAKNPRRPATRSADQRVTLYVRDGSLPAVLGDVSAQIGARLKAAGLKDRPVSIEAADSPVGEFMSSLCQDMDCRWKLETYLVVWSAGERTPEWSSAQQECSPEIQRPSTVLRRP